MPMIEYIPRKFQAKALEMIRQANVILEEYAAQGFEMTLRQLHYQFVARDLYANTFRNYKNLGSVMSAARCAGLVDWDRMVDRTRNLNSHNSWGGPAEIVGACADQFTVDFWVNQEYRPEVWIEKDALIGVLERACRRWQVPYFSCRGYSSDSEAWEAGRRMRRYGKEDKKPIIFHLGDHDPSGIDMTRDIIDRVRLFARRRIEVKRVALNMNQVEAYNPPPNFAKETDSRFADYQREYGNESWELDALDPTVIDQLVATELEALIDPAAWAESERLRDEGRRQLRGVADNWQAVAEFLAERGDEEDE